MKQNRPFLLRPTGKDYIWGGSRLNDDFAKNIDMMPLAETWECSTHPDGPSYAAGGEFTGLSLKEILSRHPEYLGTHPQSKGELPILIKFIDAKKDLSVQVHPDDEYAREYENGQLGKTEMWYVLDARPDAKLVYGLQHDASKELIRHSIATGALEKYLQRIPVQPDDVFYVEAGRIHAIGAGVLVAEIQESSNLTYRLYDYDRVDKQGNKRELHIDKALEVADLHGSNCPKQPIRYIKYQPGCATELLCRCKYFEVYRMLVNTERIRQLVEYRADEVSFRVLLCTNGCGSIFMEDGQVLRVFRGDCVFFPADSEPVKIHGRIQFLDVRG
ncbi:MAG: class I mannose-6-phosphate isomerase [Anaerovibrio sp.]|uniref:type I phosphomannose isomerase catalytic subunit n=1 Tax=Anaerovibrio sp. TaxID=1872532 RepID=UPI0025EBF7B0|nr:type I phosphomannose isomerase catalytic subunit [Anaerovibrio sp.]MCR5176500.1 class I mannose-6-phosphate isomerase [Anaerovibrio sp.]